MMVVVSQPGGNLECGTGGTVQLAETERLIASGITSVPKVGVAAYADDHRVGGWATSHILGFVPIQTILGFGSGWS